MQKILLFFIIFLLAMPTQSKPNRIQSSNSKQKVSKTKKKRTTKRYRKRSLRKNISKRRANDRRKTGRTFNRRKVIQKTLPKQNSIKTLNRRKIKKKKKCGKRCIEFQMMKRLWLNDIIRKDRSLQRRPRIKRPR